MLGLPHSLLFFTECWEGRRWHLLVVMRCEGMTSRVDQMSVMVEVSTTRLFAHRILAQSGTQPASEFDRSSVSPNSLHFRELYHSISLCCLLQLQVDFLALFEAVVANSVAGGRSRQTRRASGGPFTSFRGEQVQGKAKDENTGVHLAESEVHVFFVFCVLCLVVCGRSPNTCVCVCV